MFVFFKEKHNLIKTRLTSNKFVNSDLKIQVNSQI